MFQAQVAICDYFSAEYFLKRNILWSYLSNLRCILITSVIYNWTETEPNHSVICSLQLLWIQFRYKLFFIFFRPETSVSVNWYNPPFYYLSIYIWITRKLNNFYFTIMFIATGFLIKNIFFKSLLSIFLQPENSFFLNLAIQFLQLNDSELSWTAQNYKGTGQFSSSQFYPS